MDVARLVASYPQRLLKQLEINGRAAAAVLEDRYQDRLGRPFPPSSRLGPKDIVEENRAQVEELLLRQGMNDLERWTQG
jgi:protein-L-isoaspartate O-methyltransferase